MTNAELPPPSADAIAVSEQLQNHIREVITTHQGWIPFSHFMELALYTPKLGYYTGGAHKIGSAGDFITAPTLTPLFAQTIAQQINPLLPQTAGNVYEFGAGTGELAAGLLQHLSDGLNTYYIIEVSPELAERQRQTIAQSVPEAISQVVHLTELPAHFDGILIGNEVLDAMPVERIRHQNEQFHRLGVSLNNNAFIESSCPLTDPKLCATAQTLFPHSTTPYTSELHPTQHAFIRTLAERLTRGAMIWIDYGFDANQYYHPQRQDGTLIGHYRHHTIHNPFYHIGLTDLTAHVNFTDIAQAGTDAGLDLIGYTTQAHFLLNLGITNLLESFNPSSHDYIRHAHALHQLLGQHEMGELFKVIAFGREIEVDWQGFAYGDICHKL